MINLQRQKIEDQLKDIEIYGLISQVSNEVYVWKVKKPNHYQAYKNHIYGRKLDTKEFCKSAEERNSLPKMYLLDEIKATEKTAFSYCIAWNKYFKEHGYQLVAYDSIIGIVEELTGEAHTVSDVI